MLLLLLLLLLKPLPGMPQVALRPPPPLCQGQLNGVLLAGVDSIGRVESFFDAISYQKGGSIVRMMRAFLNNRRISQEQYGLRRSLLQVCSGCLCSGACI